MNEEKILSLAASIRAKRRWKKTPKKERIRHAKYMNQMRQEKRAQLDKKV